MDRLVFPTWEPDLIQPTDRAVKFALYMVRIAEIWFIHANDCLNQYTVMFEKNEWIEGRELCYAAKEFHSDASEMLRLARSNTFSSVQEADRPPVLELITAIQSDLDNIGSMIHSDTVLLETHWPYRPPKSAYVNTLPSEILAWIFEILVSSQFWNFKTPTSSEDRLFKTHKFPTYPFILAKVCTSWHQIVASTPALWSYIQLVASGPLRPKYYARASYLLGRTTLATPLSLRVHCPGWDDHYCCARILTQWLKPIANRIQSLNTDDDSEAAPLEAIQSILSCWLRFGSPGSVKQLALCARDNPRRRLIRPYPHSGLKHIDQSWRINLEEPQFEEFMQSIAMLHLDNVFVSWNSRAYHSLTYLHLDKGSIKEGQLVSILSHSPRLQYLFFGLRVTNKNRATPPRTPISFPDLKILELNPMSTLR